MFSRFRVQIEIVILKIDGYDLGKHKVETDFVLEKLFET
jgi:hypothetical protein